MVVAWNVRAYRTGRLAPRINLLLGRCSQMRWNLEGREQAGDSWMVCYGILFRSPPFLCMKYGYARNNVRHDSSGRALIASGHDPRHRQLFNI